MEPKELEKIIKIAKKHGAKSLEVNGVKLEFAPSRIHLESSAQPEKVFSATGSNAGDPITSTESHPELSDSELLFLSSPYFDVMQADKEAARAPERAPS